VAGCWIPEDSVIYPPCAAGYLLRDAREAAGGEGFCWAARLPRFTMTQFRLDDGSSLRRDAKHVVANWGPPHRNCFPRSRSKPRKGHLVINRTVYPGFLRHQLIELGYLKSAHAINADSVAFNCAAQAHRADPDRLIAAVSV